MRSTKDIKLSDVSSMYRQLVKIDKVDEKIKKICVEGITIDENNCKNAFVLLSMSKVMFKKDIINLLKDERIILKYNPNVALGNYVPYAPLISNTGDVKIVVNTSYFVSEKDGEYEMKITDIEGLLVGAYAVYKSIKNYTKICSNFGMRKSIIDLYVKVFIQAIRGTALFEAQKNMRYLTYILTRYISKVHFGLDKCHDLAISQAKIVDDIDMSWVMALNLEFGEDQWETLEGILVILQNKFISLNGKISMDSIRTNVGILLGAPSVLAVDYIPYLLHMSAGYYTNYNIFRSALIKKELGIECINVNNNVLTQL